MENNAGLILRGQPVAQTTVIMITSSHRDGTFMHMLVSDTQQRESEQKTFVPPAEPLIYF